ncbi:type IV pilus modification PilV family protein [Planctomicrobium sp. SH661]|uniref:type IV pilus modification PilV family protein n=1 Tax=Planctomicrobium sp. SH661 TaxID=3448124 RepID=UPI003F5ADFE9
MRQTNSNSNRTARRGISLFEVVLALAIFIGALTAITQVLRTGSRAAVRAQLESQAVLLAEQRMNEVVAGVQSLEGVNRVPFDGKSNWYWTLNISDSGTPNLLRLEVIVEHADKDDKNKVSYRLARLLRDPQVYVDAANAAATEGGTL